MKKIKKYLFLAALGTLVVCSAGCGKTKDEITSESISYIDETTVSLIDETTVSLIDETTMSQIADTGESIGYIDEMTVSPIADTTESPVVKTHYEPKQEIIDADFLDFKFQLEDTVFVCDGKISLMDFVNQFPDKYKFLDNFGEELIYDNWLTGKRWKVFYLVPEDFKDFINVDSRGWLRFRIINTTDEPVQLKNCVVGNLEVVGPAFSEFPDFQIKQPCGDFFLPKGIPVNYDCVECMEDERFNYDNLANTISSYDLTNVGWNFQDFTASSKMDAPKELRECIVLEGCYAHISIVSDDYIYSTTYQHLFDDKEYECDVYYVQNFSLYVSSETHKLRYVLYRMDENMIDY